MAFGVVRVKRWMLIEGQILKPIETTGLTNTDVDELVKKTREEMLAVLKGFTVEGKKDN